MDAVDDSPGFARNESSPVFLLPVWSVGSLGFFGDESITAAASGEEERDRLPSRVIGSGFGNPDAKNPSMPR